MLRSIPSWVVDPIGRKTNVPCCAGATVTTASETWPSEPAIKLSWMRAYHLLAQRFVRFRRYVVFQHRAFSELLTLIDSGIIKSYALRCWFLGIVINLALWPHDGDRHPGTSDS